MGWKFTFPRKEEDQTLPEFRLPCLEWMTSGLPVIQQERVFGIGSSNGTWLRGPWDEETRENSNLLEIEMSNVIRKVCRSRRDIVEQLAARVVPQASFMRKGEKV